MAYISYEKVPLYFGLPNSNSFPTETAAANTGVFCESLQFNHTPNLSPTRIVGVEPGKNSFILAGSPNSTLSFSAYVGTSEFDPTDFTGNVGITGATFRIGDAVNGISGSGAFLTSFSYTLAPYQPVLVQCDFAIYQPVTVEGGQIADAGSNTVIDNLNFADYGHGAYSTFDDTYLDDISVVESVQYQFSCSRLPFYGKKGTTNSLYLRDVAYQTAEHSITVQGDNIQKLIPITGINPGPIALTVKNSATTTIFTSTVDGKLNAENVTIQGGDLARGSVTITELLV
jgi:hypothetical protein